MTSLVAIGIGVLYGLLYLLVRRRRDRRAESISRQQLIRRFRETERQGKA
jgi:hypothetical protein